MSILRPSRPGDIPRLRLLWQLAFGDSEAYMDNFFNGYYRPERLVVLEDGDILSMAAVFDTELVSGPQSYRTGYLYAVATHPDARGKGLAGALLGYADKYLRTQGYQAVTTVPAQPSLHDFFAANGFRECFRLSQGDLNPSEIPAPKGDSPLRPATPAQYKAVRDALLADYPHPYVRYPEDALAYQAGCCALGGGGLYVGETSKGPVCLCAEGDGQGLMLFKERLGGFAPEVDPHLTVQFPAQRWLLRSAPSRRPGCTDMWKFGMLKWLDPKLEKGWNWDTVGYLGLAFD